MESMATGVKKMNRSVKYSWKKQMMFSGPMMKRLTHGQQSDSKAEGEDQAKEKEDDEKEKEKATHGNPATVKDAADEETHGDEMETS